jgi:peptidoglycan hydrolase-like protein with peptidoglycan-binding domain
LTRFSSPVQFRLRKNNSLSAIAESMTNRNWLAFVAAVLLMSATPRVSARSAATTQSSPRTRKTISSKSKKKTKPKVHGQTAPTPDRIREIQTALNREGALDREPTGKWDDTTTDAMKKFQGNHGLNPTGKIDAGTLNKLGLGSDTAGKGAPVPVAVSAAPTSTSAH